MNHVTVRPHTAASAFFLAAFFFTSSLAQAQTPSLTNAVPAESFAGEQFCYNLELNNSGNPGYGPYIRLITPPDLSFDSATFLGTGVTTVNLGLFPAAPGNQLTDPRTGDPVTGPEGGSLRLLIYPVGSVVTGGPPLVLETCLSIDTAAVVGTPLDVTAQAVYEFGDTPTGDNGPISGAAETNAVTPTVVILSKSNDASEGERVPGPGFTYGYTLNVDVANGKSVFDLTLNDTLSADLQYAGNLNVAGGVNCSVGEPGLMTPGGVLSIGCDRVDGTAAGNDLAISYDAYIIDTLDETNCTTELEQNNVSLDAEHPDDNVLPQSAENSQVTAKHLAIQKGVSPGSGRPGDTVTYTINFQVSEFAAADSLVLTDLLPDGVTFQAHQGLDLGAGNLAITPTVTPFADGSTQVVYDIGAVTGTLSAATTGSLSYTAVIDQEYEPGPNDPVLASDSLSNSVVADYTLTAGATGCSDGSGATLNIEPITISKSIVSPQAFYVPGETITYRLSMQIPSGDTENIVFEDFFPLPVLDATALDTNTNLGANADIDLSPTDTLGLTPAAITTDAATNSLRIEWPDIDTLNTATLSVDVAITVVDDPYADNLFLTNLFQASSDNSDPISAVGLTPVQMLTRAPELTLTKGVSASDNPSADATISPSPASLPVDGDISASDAGDTITYNITVENVGGASAHDVIVTDPAVSGLTGCAIVSVTNGDGTPLAYRDPADTDPPAAPGMAIPTDLGGGIRLDDPLSANDGTVGPPYSTDTALISYSCTLAGTAEAGEVLGNTASTTWASGSGAVVFPAVNDDASVTMAQPAIVKTLSAIAPGYAGNLSEAQIGEAVSYQVVITLPEGTANNVTLTDQLDNGLAFTDVVSITPSSGDVTTDAAGGFPGVLAGAAFSSSGAGTHQLDRRLSLDFGTVTNANTDNATAETITVVYRARLLNWDGNDRGDTRNNQASWSWDNPNAAGSLTIQDGAPNLTLIEPELQVVKTLSAATGDAGDVITVTLDISHTGASDGDAFDVTLEDVLPAGFSFASGFTTMGLAPSTGPSHSLGTVTAGWNSFSQGNTAQIQFSITLDAGVSPQQTIQNTAGLEWESLQTADQAALPSPPNNTLGVERTGDSMDTGGSANVYTDSDQDSIDVTAASIAKSIDGISPGGASPDITVSDRITYRLTVTPPEGQTGNLVIVDDLPAGFSFQSAMLDTTGFDGSVSLASALVTGGSVDSGQEMTITFGATTTVNGDNNPADNSFAVLLVALVADSASNAATAAAQSKTNTATLSYTGSSGTIQDTVDMDFTEPDLSITKTLSPDSGLEAGDTVTVSLQVTNSGTAPAYDLVITDTLNDDGALFDLTSPAQLSIPAGYSYGYSDPTVTISADNGTTLAAGGAMASFSFTATVAADVITGSTYNNTAAVTGNGNEDAPGDPERDSNDTGMDSATTGSPTSGKTLLGSSESWTSDTAPIEAAIGELLTYRAAITLPEGLTRADGNLVTDTLPAGFQYQSGSASIRAVRDNAIGSGSFTIGAWGSGSNTTRDHSLRRMDSVCAGDTDSGDGFNPATQWDSFPQDSFGGLGSHGIACGVPADIIISEYVEGSGNNQALEFFNGTGGLIDLNAGTYIIELYENGSAVPTATINLSGTVADGSVYVLGNSAAAAGITGVADQTDAGLDFDGNDVIVLKSGGAGGTTLDVIGQIGALDSIPTTPVPIEPTVNGQDIEFDLGDISNSDQDAGVEQLILEYDVLVLNSADNARTDMESNTVSFNYLNRDGMGQSVTDMVSLTLVEPSASVSKMTSPATVQGGETVTFTVRLTNESVTNGTRAWEPAIHDDLPAEFQNLMLTSATLSRGSVDLSACVTISSGEIIDLDASCLSASERYLAQGEFIELVYTADIDPSIGFEQQVTNTATGSFTSLPGSNGTGGSTPGSPGDADGERTGSGVGENDLRDTDPATVTAGKPTVDKTGDANLQILDTTTMQIQVDVPVGTTNSFVITDDLPAGLRYTGTANITPPAMNFTASNTPTAPAAGTDPLVFDFGTITNSAASAQAITITYGVQVENVLANQDTSLLDNTATLSYQGASMPLPADSATITVIEPDLEIVKTITGGASGSDAGDDIDYQVVVSNTSTQATAYRVDLSDVLPGDLLGGAPAFAGITLDNPGNAVLKSAGGTLAAGDAVISTTTNTDDTLGWPLFDLPPNTSLTITYQATLANTVMAGDTLQNQVTAVYDSLAAGDGRDATDSSDDDDANLDNYGETDSAVLTVDSGLAAQKTLNAIHADNDFSIGDAVTFDLRVDLIEGITANLAVTDLLPTGLDYEGPIRIVAGPHISYNGTGTAVEAPAGTLTIDMGDITNTPDGNSANDFFIIEVDARVQDVVGNAAGNPALVNSMTVGADVGTAGPDTQAIDVVEPNLTVSKTADTGTPSLGDEVTFTVQLQHDSSTADAYDVVLTDAIPAGLSYIPGSHSGDGSVNETDPSNLVFSLGTLTLAEMSKSFTFRCRVDLDATVGAPISNSVDLSYDSQSGSPAVQRTYNASDSESVTPSTPLLIDAVKSVSIATDGGTAGLVDPGDTLEYRITLNNGGSPLTGVVFRDTIPANTSYVAASLASDTGTPNDTADPNLAVDVGSLGAGASVNISFRVTVDAGTPTGTLISNQGSVDSQQTVPEPTDADGVDGNGDQPTDIRVGGAPPLANPLYLSKTLEWLDDADASGDLSPGDTLRYTLVPENLGGSALTNVSLSDTLPTGLSYVAASAASTAGTVDVIGAAFSAGIPSLAAGDFELVTFEVTIDAPLVDFNLDAQNERFTNQAQASSDLTDPVPSDGNLDPSDGNQPTIFTAVDGAAGSPALDVEKRWSLATDSDGDGLVDPGDTLQYVITLHNSGAASATDVRLADSIPADTQVVGGSVSTSQGTVIGEDPLDLNLGDLAPGALASVVFRVRVDGAAADGSVISNQATVSADGGVNESSDDNADDGDGKNPTLTPVDSGGGTGSPGGLVKTLHGSSEADSSADELFIGEVATFRISVDMPSGLLGEAVILDTLPTGLSYVPGSARLRRVFDTGLSAAQDPGGVNSAASGVFVALSDGGELRISGQDLRLELGDVINSDNDANPETYTLEYRAVAANIAGNQAGGSLSNGASLSFLDALGQSAGLSQVSAGVDLIEPAIQAGKNASPAGLISQGGDVQYTLSFSNPDSGNTAHAYDLSISDPLPAEFQGLSVDSITPSGGVSGITDNSAGTTLDVSVASFPPDGSLVIVYTASATGPLSDGSIDNAASYTWTSLPGTQGTGNATPGSPGDADGERTGSGLGSNDYLGSSAASVAVGGLNLEKTVENPASRYPVGALVSYRLRASVPASAVVRNLLLQDVLDEGLSYVSGSLSLSLDTGLNSSKSPGDFTRTDDSPITGQETLELDLGTVSNTNASAAAITLDYQARVDNSLGNQDNQTLGNQARLSFTDPSGSLGDGRSITLGEPRLSLIKTITSPTTDLDAGDSLSFSVALSNIGTTGAFEVVLSDSLPAGLENLSNLRVDSSSGGAQVPVLTNNGGDWISSAFDLPVGGSLSLSFDAQLADSVLPGQTLQNQVTAGYSSLDGSVVGERDGSTPASDQSDDSALNNYNVSAQAPTVTVADPLQLDKRFHPDAAATRYGIGESVGYRLTLSLAEGTVDDVVITDTLPDGLRFEQAVLGLGNLGITTANPGTPMQSGQTLSFDLGQVRNPANGDAMDDFLTLDIQATVEDLPANVAGTVLGNHAGVGFTGAGGPVTRDFDADATTPGIQPLDLTLVEPEVQASKSADPLTVPPGDLVSFTLLLDHTATSSADAFDLVVVDTLPAGLAYEPGSASLPVTVSGQQLRFDLASLTLLEDNTSISYQARVLASAGLGSALLNSMTLDYDGQPGAPADQRAYADSDSVSVTVNETTRLEAFEQVVLVQDANGNGQVDPGDVLEYRVDISNVGAADATQVVFSNTVPANTIYQPGSLGSSQGVTWDADGQNLVVTMDGLSRGDSVSIVFRVVVDSETPGGTLVSSQGSVDSAQTVPEATDGDTDPGNGNQPTDVRLGTPPPTPSPGMYLEKTVALSADTDPLGSANPGDTMRYTLVLTNTGNQVLNNLSLTDTLPQGLSFANSQFQSEGLLTVSGGSLSWNGIAGLVPGASITAWFEVDVDEFGPSGNPGSYSNQASAASDQTSGNLSDGNGNPLDGLQPTVFFVSVQPPKEIPGLPAYAYWLLLIAMLGLGLSRFTPFRGK